MTMTTRARFKQAKHFINAVIRYLGAYGLIAFIKKIKTELILKLKSYKYLSFIQNTSYISGKKFSSTQSLNVYQSPIQERRLNFVIDSINKYNIEEDLSNGLIFAILLAKKLESPLRVVTQTEKALEKNFDHILSSNNIFFTKNVEFIFLKNSKLGLDVNTNDIFLTTCRKTEKILLQSMQPSQIIYIPHETVNSDV